ncbi:MAG: endolytic transglycosylase MltG [Bdellovibrionales bacterium]|nr:endolytic transglycosylase MltG [Bdellovibrionales bacterium]
MKFIFRSSLIFLFFGILFLVWEGFKFISVPVSLDKDKSVPNQVFEVFPHESFYHVLERLQQNGFISGPLALKWIGRITGTETKIKTGEYALHGKMTPYQILQTLSSGKSIEHSLTFTEGMNLYEMAQAIEGSGLGSEKDFIKIAHNQTLIKNLLGEKLDSLEGYLFPETYKFTKYTPMEKIVRVMVENFLSNYNSLIKGTPPPPSRHNIVILASLIEKETGAPSERALISSVFHNRIRLGMRLQSDPTIIYGKMVETGRTINNITREDLRQKNSYNTYAINGLPKGPISNPGRDSLLAALKPETSQWLYFVSKNNGTHTFSSTLEQHLQAVNKYQLDPRARSGKSWRDLKQKK